MHFARITPNFQYMSAGCHLQAHKWSEIIAFLTIFTFLHWHPEIIILKLSLFTLKTYFVRDFFHMVTSPPFPLPFITCVVVTMNMSWLPSQDHLNKISDRTDRKEMKLNTKKSNYMIFNFSKEYQINKRLSLHNNLLE